MKNTNIICIITLLMATMIALCPLGSGLLYAEFHPNIIPITQENDTVQTTTTQPDIELVDISFEGMRIIATIRNTGDESMKTVMVKFSKSNLITDTPTNPIHIRDMMTEISAGETKDVTMKWIGFGHYIIQVEVVGFDVADQEVWWFLFFGWEVNS